MTTTTAPITARAVFMRSHLALTRCVMQDCSSTREQHLMRRSNVRQARKQVQRETGPVLAEDGEALLTTNQLARELGVSRVTIDRARAEGRIQAVPHGNGFAFRRVETLEIGDIRKQTNAIARAKFDGERDAAVVEMLERGATVAEITAATKTALEVVARLRQTWLAIRAIEQRESTAQCSGCGAPPHPKAALCLSCFRQSRRLTDAERKILSGQPIPTPNTCICLGCAETIRNEDAEHLCHRCERKLKIGVHGGILAITLDDDTVRVLSVEETRDLVRQLAHHLPAPATEAIVPPPILPVIPDEPARQSISERIKKLKEELETP